MTVYVDGPIRKHGPMSSCHLIADSDDELHAMAALLGVPRHLHLVGPTGVDSHYDIGVSKRALAIEKGATLITWRESGSMTMRRRVTGALGMPVDAEQWSRDNLASRLVYLGAKQ